jgi:hypothetical protein
MVMATHDTAGHDAATKTVVPMQDPDHDIDAKKTVTWLLASTVFVFASVWVLWIVFGQVIFQEHRDKVELAPRAQLEELREQERQALSQNGGIEQSMRDYVEKRSR